MMKGTFQINYRKEAIKEIIKLRKRLKGASKVSHTSLQIGCITLAWLGLDKNQNKCAKDHLAL